MPIKEILYDFCQSFIEARLNRINDNIRAVQESLISETKSSAGDKHETGRAMLQLEREKLGQQLAEAESVIQVLAKVPIDKSSTTIRAGSLVKTTTGFYFLAISAGACKVKDDTIYCISPKTPMGRLLFAKAIGDTFTFNGTEIIILEVT